MYRTGDFLIQLKNASLAHKGQLVYPHSKVISAIAKILNDEGYVKSATEKEVEGRKMVVVDLKYSNGESSLSNIHIVSKPSVHYYATNKQMKKIRGKFGITILSTSSGIMTGAHAAQKGVGGEVICEVE